jgi:cysteine desulfurase family protein (TIGR01976 family)
VSTATLDVAAVRARFSALDRKLAFFDGPGGTQCPDEVIDAISAYLREDNANIGAPYETSVRTVELIANARAAAGRFLGCHPDEVAFGPSMTALSFLLTRTLGRTLARGDEILVTRLDHDANVAPWLELAHDLGVVVRFVGVHDDLTLDLGDLERQLSERTRVVAFPVAANAVGTLQDVGRIVELAHGAGAIAWADAVHYGPHGPIDVSAWDVDVVLCSPYKFYGPHLGLAFGKRGLLESWRPYKVRPAEDEPVGNRFQHGTQQHELLAGFVACVEYVESLGWDAIVGHETALGQQFLDGLPERVQLYGPPTMSDRVPTFCFNVPGRTPPEVATALAAADLAVWHGDYYAVEVMRHLGLGEAGAVRAGLMHYNTESEVDRLLEALHAL